MEVINNTSCSINVRKIHYSILSELIKSSYIVDVSCLYSNWSNVVWPKLVLRYFVPLGRTPESSPSSLQLLPGNVGEITGTVGH